MFTRSITLSLGLLLVSLPLPAGLAGVSAQENEAPASPSPAATATPDPNLVELQTKEEELAALEAKIAALKSKQASAGEQADLAESQVEQLNQELQLAQLQLQQTRRTVTTVNGDIEQVAADIEQINIGLESTRQQLADILIALYQHEQTSVVDIMLENRATLSTLLAEQHVYYQLQSDAFALITSLRTREEDAAARQQELAERQRELEQLQAAQAYQQALVASEQRERQRVLALKQEQQASYAHQLAEAAAARDEITRQIFTLKDSGKVVQLTDAFSAARYASSVTGVRPSVLLAVLKVETNVGQSLGTGTFPDDMHPASRDAFLRLTSKLGLDPKQTPISRRPASYAGWGGAIGPGQFLPDTWERLEPRVAALMNKPVPSPFELADALVGVGIMLADRGASDGAHEVEALARYLAGPNWPYHTWYSRRVLAVADEYGKEGLL